ncbi:MAG: amidohydrolase family protein [bacterium]|nr:amidohydrolase family protein [bacterium]
MTFDILIKGGTVLDGARDEGYLADVGIVGDRIKAIGNLSDSSAGHIIPAEEKYVTPGFIDVQNHSDSYLKLIETPLLPSLISQGITTIAVGHCGASLGPLPSLDALRSMQKWGNLIGANLNWLNFEEFLDSISRYPLGPNVLSLVGHATMRRGLLKDEVRPATPEEVEIEGKLLRESLEAGAAGLSMGLVYAHEVNADSSELESVAKIVGRANKLLSVHLRSEKGHIVEALDEIIGIARKVQARVKISHFKIQGAENWKFFESALGAVDRAYQSGLDIFFDVYPYTSTWSVLYTYLPKWAYEGGKIGLLKSIRDPASRERIVAYLSTQADLGQILVASSDNNPAFIGKTLDQIAKNQEVSIPEALLKVIEGTSVQVGVFDHNVSPEIMQELLRHPLSVIATDGAGYSLERGVSEGLVHPRCFGAMPKFLSMVREKKFLSWPAAIKKMTSRPAEKLKLEKRGKLLKDFFADLVIFDPRDVGSKASYPNPFIAPDGIDQVLINGQLVFEHGSSIGRPAGRVLRIK